MTNETTKDGERAGFGCIAPSCHQWDGTDTCTCQRYDALNVLERAMTALRVLKTMLAKEELAGVDVANELLADIASLMPQQPEAAGAERMGEAQPFGRAIAIEYFPNSKNVRRVAFELDGSVTQLYASTAPAGAVSRDAEIAQLIDERDAFELWADKLANAIAAHFDIDIGEHSSANLPWFNALDAIKAVASAGAGKHEHCINCGMQVDPRCNCERGRALAARTDGGAK